MSSGLALRAVPMPPMMAGSFASSVPSLKPASAARAPAMPHTAAFTSSALSAIHCSAPSMRLTSASVSVFRISGPPSFQMDEMASPMADSTLAAFSAMGVWPMRSLR